MSWSYTYDPDLWPALISCALIVFLGWYSWRRRRVPGALSFAIGSLFAALWTIGTALEISAVDVSTKIVWIKFQAVWQLPTATALFCFILIYAGLGRWFTRRNLILLAIPPLLVLGLITTNDYHNLFWTQFGVDEPIRKFVGSANWFFFIYGYILLLINIIVLFWLGIRSPQHRWPVAIMLFGQLTGRGLYLLDRIYAILLSPGESIFILLGLLSSMYALALFRFHVFDPIPLARVTVIEQMNDGMLVLDLQGRIVDLNSAAVKILAEPAAKLLGTPVIKSLSLSFSALSPPDNMETVQSEISFGKDDNLRYFNLTLKPLVDRRGQALGQLILLHEVTDQKRAQAEIIEQKQVMATLQERERLARELHDSIGQVLGFVNIQGQIIGKWMQAGDINKAQSLLTRLVEVARDAHADVRESILSLKAGSSQKWSFFPTLKQYLDNFQSHYGIQTQIIISEGLKEGSFDPGVEVQLLRVIQEAMINAQKHSGAHNLRIAFQQTGTQATITITDDGAGFDPSQLNLEAGGHFGLAFMRERMEQAGGSLIIDSKPGAGTVVKLDAPLRNQSEEMK